MKVRSLSIRGVEGLDPRGLELEQLDAPVVLLIGPNGSGKSTTRRCLEQLLFQNHDRLRAADLRGEFTSDAGDDWTAAQRNGGLSWSAAGESIERPDLPSPARADCYAIGARELLTAGSSEADFAKQVRLEMAGGFDLSAIRGSLAKDVAAPRFAAAAAGDVTDAQRKLLDVERKLDTLADEERALEELHEAIERAEESSQQLARLRAAHKELTAAQVEVARETTAVEDCDAELTTLDEGLSRVEADGPLLDEETLDRASREVAELGRAAADRHRAEERLAQAAAREERERATLTDEQRGSLSLPELSTIERLEELAAQREQLSARAEGARERLDLLGDDEGATLADPETLGEAVRDLQNWLASSPARLPWIPGTGTLIAGLLLTALSGAGVVAISGWFGVPLGIGIAVVLYAVQVRQSLVPLRRQQADARAGFESRGLPDAPHWEAPAVNEFVRRLREESERGQRRERERYERERLQRTRDDAQGQLEALESEQAKLAAQCGAELAGRTLAEWLRRQRDWHAASVELQSSCAALDNARGEVAARTRALAELLGAADGGEGVEALEARLNAARKRTVAHVKQTEARKQTDQRRTEAATRRQRAQEEAERAALVLEVEPTLQADELEARIAPRLERLESEAQELAALREKNSEINTRLKIAREQGEWENAREEADRSRLALSAKFEQRVDELCADVLIADAEREYERSARPKVLISAAELFAKFTHQRYELEAAERPGGDPRFAARDTEAGARRELEELSDGTRMQLLLALRIAFAQEGELGEKVPIVLDEVFSMSDPARMIAMVDALGQLAEEGRQVMYLGADPSIEAAWRQIAEEQGHTAPRVVHLDRVQRGIRGVAEAAALAVRTAVEVPPSEGMQPEEYGKLLGVGLLSPFEDAGALHLFHLLRHDLAALERLLRLKIDTLGKWERLSSRDGGAGAIGGEALAADLDRRVAAARALVEAWHVGRGRRIGRAELEETKAVSASWYDRIESFLEEHHGSAALLMEGLEKPGDERDSRLKGFRGDKVTTLRSFLVDIGALDPREPLAPEDQDQRVREAAPDLDPLEVTRLADTLRAHLEG